jgi:hypothetical protein
MMMGETSLGDGDGAAGAPELIGAVALECDEQLAAALEEDFAVMAAAQGRIVVRLGEYERRQSFGLEGATSVVAWAAERYGISTASARALAQVGEKAPELPVLVGSLCAGELSLDKVRAVLKVASAENDAGLCAQARVHGVRQLADLAQTSAQRLRAGAQTPGSTRSGHDRRYLRFNDACRTLTAQLPAESYAQAKACLEARARQIPSEGVAAEEGGTSGGKIPWDQPT